MNSNGKVFCWLKKISVCLGILIIIIGTTISLLAMMRDTTGDAILKAEEKFNYKYYPIADGTVMKVKMTEFEKNMEEHLVWQQAAHNKLDDILEELKANQKLIIYKLDKLER